MTISFNSERYNKGSVHKFFKQGRKSIKAHGITDEHGHINNALKLTEFFVHMLGGLPDISDLDED